MTEKLKQMLHERTDSVDFAMPDLDALTRDGDRRIRRRRPASWPAAWPPLPSRQR